MVSRYTRLLDAKKSGAANVSRSFGNEFWMIRVSLPENVSAPRVRVIARVSSSLGPSWIVAQLEHALGAIKCLLEGDFHGLLRVGALARCRADAGTPGGAAEELLEESAKIL